jgi:hypothetical protein
MLKKVIKVVDEYQAKQILHDDYLFIFRKKLLIFCLRHAGVL